MNVTSWTIDVLGWWFVVLYRLKRCVTFGLVLGLTSPATTYAGITLLMDTFVSRPLAIIVIFCPGRSQGVDRCKVAETIFLPSRLAKKVSNLEKQTCLFFHGRRQGLVVAWSYGDAAGQRYQKDHLVGQKNWVPQWVLQVVAEVHHEQVGSRWD